MFFANYLLSSITLTDGEEATGSCYQLEKLLDVFPRHFISVPLGIELKKRNI